MLLSAAWVLQKVLSLGGLAVGLVGVAIFGWHFVRINAAAAQGDTSEIPPESWRGVGARFGLSILAAGVAFALASMILAAMLPSRY
jgi:hypothetical protein